jgi:hypothetical protein
MRTVLADIGRLLLEFLRAAIALLVKEIHGLPSNPAKQHITKAQYAPAHSESDLPKVDGDGTNPGCNRQADGAPLQQQIKTTIASANEMARLKEQLATAREELRVERLQHAITRAENIDLVKGLQSKREEALVALAEALVSLSETRCAQGIPTGMSSLSEAGREYQTLYSITQEKAAKDEANIAGLQSRIAKLEAERISEKSQTKDPAGPNGLEGIPACFVDGSKTNPSLPSSLVSPFTECEPFEVFRRHPLPHSSQEKTPGPSMREVIVQKEQKIAVLKDKLSECYSQLVASRSGTRESFFLPGSELLCFDPYDSGEDESPNLKDRKGKSYSAPSSIGRPSPLSYPLEL